MAPNGAVFFAVLLQWKETVQRCLPATARMLGLFRSRYGVNFATIAIAKASLLFFFCLFFNTIDEFN